MARVLEIDAEAARLASAVLMKGRTIPKKINIGAKSWEAAMDKLDLNVYHSSPWWWYDFYILGSNSTNSSSQCS